MNNNIAGSLLNNIANNQSISSNTVSGQDTAAIRAAVINMLRDIKPGDVVTGQLLNKESTGISLLLKNNILLNTKLEENVNLAIGKQVTFEVTNNQKGQLTLRPMFTNLNNSSTILNALNEAKIPVSDNSVKMVTELMRNNMPIDRESLLSVNKDVNLYSSYEPEDIVLLNKMGLEVNDNNVKEMHLYRNNNQWMMESVSEAADQLSNMIFEAVANKDSNLDKIIDGLDKIFNFDNNIEAVIDSEKVDESDILPSKADLDNVAVKDGASYDTNKPEINENIKVDINTKQDVVKETANGTSLDKNISLTLAQSKVGVESEIDSTNRLKSNLATDKNDEKSDEGKEVIDNNKSENEAITSKNVFDILKRNITNTLSNKDKADIKNALVERLKENMLMKPEDFGKEKYVRRYYERTLQLTEDLEKLLNENGKSEGNFAKTVTIVKNNMEFMNKINEFYNYVQLPLKMNDKHSNGDLYVYAKKRNKLGSSNNEELTALLHLSMEYLGNMDIFLTLRNGDNLSTKFTLEKEEMIDFIEAHIDELNKRLVDKGYNIGQTLVEKSEKKTENPIENILKEEGNRVLLSTGAFDARA